MKLLLKEVQAEPMNLGGVESQEITRMGQVVLARLMETQIWCPLTPARCMGGRLNKGTVMPAHTSSWPADCVFVHEWLGEGVSSPKEQ